MWRHSQQKKKTNKKYLLPRISSSTEDILAILQCAPPFLIQCNWNWTAASLVIVFNSAWLSFAAQFIRFDVHSELNHFMSNQTQVLLHQINKMLLIFIVAAVTVTQDSLVWYMFCQLINIFHFSLTLQSIHQPNQKSCSCNNLVIHMWPSPTNPVLTP